MKQDDRNSIINEIWERPASDRPKMPRSQRAKQFAPFDALTGLGQRLKQAEAEHESQEDGKEILWKKSDI